MSVQLPSFNVPFKRVDGVELLATVFPTTLAPVGVAGAPCMLFFHSGGITGGSRLDHLPAWLVFACHEVGWHFVTVDYRLLPFASMSDIFEDFMAAYDLIVSPKLSSLLTSRGRAPVDCAKIVIAGASAGVYAATSLTNALVQRSAVPAAFFGLYGQTNIGNSFYNTVKAANVDLGPASRQSMEDLSYLFSQRRAVVAGPIKWFSVSRDQVPSEGLEEYDRTTL